jgi:hypothetical protein
MQSNDRQWFRWAVPLWVGLTLAAGLILWFSPAEQTLGQGMKWVYIHVAFIWTAMLGMLIVGGLSLLQVFSDQAGWRLWGRAASWVTLGLLALAILTSVIVMQVNWGGISWDEPRTQSLLRATAVWIIAHIAGPWIPDRRVRGLLVAVAIAVALLPMRFGPLVIHPQDPLGMSSSNAIRLDSVALFGVALAASASLTWVIKQRLKP